MRRPYLVPLLAVAAWVFLAPVSAAPSRIVAIGDVHGAAEPFVAILQRAGLINAERRWIGGTAMLVQTGDLMDRGTAVRADLDLLMALEPQASAAGGRVQVVLGNHEFMNLLGQTRDVAPELYERFADERSEQKRDQAFQAAARLKRSAPLDKASWLAERPLGYLEYREALRANAPYGKWLRSKPVVVEIDGTVFMHGGINPEFTTESLDNINRRARRELTEWDDGVRWLQQHDLGLPFFTWAEVLEVVQSELTRLGTKRKQEALTEDDVDEIRVLLPLLNIGDSSLLNPDGPVWFRGYSPWTDAEGEKVVAQLLRRYRVKRFVTGHTPQPTGRITSRFGGALFLIDTGMLDGKFYPSGQPSALEIEGERVTPLYVGR
jgi:3',5'-cyclic AMP phosphodiesterase CpdA